MNAFSVLTPYLVPPALRGLKAVNLGDGFILSGIERRMGPFESGATFTNRIAPAPEALAVLDRSRGVILAGANQLNDDFAPWPGATTEQISALGAPLIPFGIGLNGDSRRAQGLGPNARAIIELIHERIEYSAWRDPLTVAYLRRELPRLSDRFLMTGCAVAYDAPVLESRRVHEGDRAIAVTVTDREEFWERETNMLDAVAKLFPRARRAMVLQQDFVALGRPWNKAVNPDRNAEALRGYARRNGYEVIAPASADEAASTYRGFDLHIGSRAHVHLLFLSQNKRSLLAPVDDRAHGFAAAYGFALSTPQSLAVDLAFDFEAVRAQIQRNFEVLRQFEASLSGVRSGVRS